MGLASRSRTAIGFEHVVSSARASRIAAACGTVGEREIALLCTISRIRPSRHGHSSAQAGPSFKLLRWFSIASLVLVTAFAAGNAMLISSFLSKYLLEREAQVTRDFTQNVLQADESMDFLLDPSNATLAERFRGSIAHFTAMPDVLRMNVYSTNGSVLRSTDKSIVGRRFSHNHELDEALRGDLVVESGRITAEVRRKPEHVGLPADSEVLSSKHIFRSRA